MRVGRALQPVGQDKKVYALAFERKVFGLGHQHGTVLAPVPDMYAGAPLVADAAGTQKILFYQPDLHRMVAKHVGYQLVNLFLFPAQHVLPGGAFQPARKLYNVRLLHFTRSPMPALMIPAPVAYQSALRDQVQLLAIPAFSDNYIWMVCQGEHAIVVDPGQAEPVDAILAQHGLHPDAILLTHHHHDHVGGVSELLDRYPNTVIYGPATETLPACHHPVAQGSTISFDRPRLSLSVLDVPGHTAGHIAYAGQLDGQPVVFCGDTLFAAGCGRVFEGTPAQMLDSLSRLAQLPPETLVCCAHEYTLSNLAWALAVEPGNLGLEQRQAQAQAIRDKSQPTLPSTLELELATNPFLRTAEPAVVAAAEKYAGQPLTSPAAVFAALRDWKNNF